MNRHPFEPLSAALGIIAIAIGLAVMTGSIDNISSNGGAWVAAAALVLGLGLIPRAQRRITPEVDSPSDIDHATET
jgi:hypothetical protein